MKYTLALVIALAFQCFQLAHSAPLEEIEDVYRLPKHVKPLEYEIKITPYILKDGANRKRFEFDGEVKIKLQVVEENKKTIVLHKKDIEVDEIKLLDNDGKEIKFEQHHNSKTDLYTLEFENDLPKSLDGKYYTLEIKYNGKMKDDMKGFYKSSYKDETGKEIWIGSTQFQTHHARRAFPCFDEPEFKAIFSISINHEKEFTNVISNMAIDGTPEPNGDQILTKFKPTPKMSTYIVAFLISNFQDLSKEDFTVVARKEFTPQLQYSLDDGQKLLTALDLYTDLPYKTLGNTKMHMAAIPDFSAGAMENWGLLTYRERGLLYDPTESTDSAQQSIALVIAHEQTHMWFGDYVTCDWWSHTWLNEGFARYFQYVAAQKVYPNWHLDQQFVVDQIHTVFIQDSLDYTHPLSEKESKVNTPEELGKMFDSISYNKGASVIRMFRHAIGEDQFKTALNEYLKTMKLQNSKPSDLFEEFEKQWKPENVKTREFFNEWTEQVGYPVVTVKVQDKGKKIKVSQERFLLEKDAGDKTLKYTIPFTFTTQKEPKFGSPQPNDIVFFKDEKEIEIPEAKQLSGSDFIIANIEQIGYYRVMYEEKMWHNIHKALNSKDHGKIGEINRAHLVDDLFNFGRSGSLKYDVIFDVLAYLKTETNYLPWNAAFRGFSYIETKLGKDNSDLKKRLGKILKKVYEHVKFESSSNEDRLDTYNRAKVLHWACKYDFSDCNKKANGLFNDFVKDQSKKIDKNIRSAVYCSALRNADKTDQYKFLVEHFEKTKVPTEKTLVLNALGCIRKAEHIKTHYEYILSANVRKQDKLAAINALISENPENAEQVFKLIEEKPKDLVSAFGTEDDLATVVTNIAGRFNTPEQQKLIEKFAEKDFSGSVKEKLKTAAKNIEKNIAWLKTYKTSLTKALRGGVAAKAVSWILIGLATIMCYMMVY